LSVPPIQISSQTFQPQQQQQQTRTSNANKINDELTFLMGSQSASTIATSTAPAKSFQNELDDLMASIEPANKTDPQQPQIVNIQSAASATNPTQYHNDSLNSSLIDDFAQLDGLYDSNDSTAKNQWCDVDVTKNTSYLVSAYKLPTNKDNLEVTIEHRIRMPRRIYLSFNICRLLSI
jgi:hypothetical protein